MGDLAKKNSGLPKIPKRKPDKVQTYGGIKSARKTKIYRQGDGSIVKVTRRINADDTITDKIEHRHS